MVKAIFSEVKSAWYCKRCKKSNQILFIDGKNRFGECCFPKERLDEVKFYNQNRMAIKEVDYVKILNTNRK